MPVEAGSYNINDVIFQVGAALDDISGGFGDGAVLTITPGGDEASGVAGAKGSVMLVQRTINLYTISIVFLPTSTSIDTVSTLRTLGQAFPINYQNGSSLFSGFALLQNRGDEVVDTGGGTRTLSFICVRTLENLGAMGIVLQEIPTL